MRGLPSVFSRIAKWRFRTMFLKLVEPLPLHRPVVPVEIRVAESREGWLEANLVRKIYE